MHTQFLSFLSICCKWDILKNIKIEAVFTLTKWSMNKTLISFKIVLLALTCQNTPETSLLIWWKLHHHIYFKFFHILKSWDECSVLGNKKKLYRVKGLMTIEGIAFAQSFVSPKSKVSRICIESSWQSLDIQILLLYKAH